METFAKQLIKKNMMITLITIIQLEINAFAIIGQNVKTKESAAIPVYPGQMDRPYPAVEY